MRLIYEEKNQRRFFMKKKITAVLLATLVVGSSVALVSCNEETGEQRVMNISLNPEVEFVLDANDKVVSVNALNEEGNLVVSAEAFKEVEGKTAEEAGALFIQVSKETGFLLEGSVQSGENTVQISVSGKADIQGLYEDVKNSMEESLKNSGLTVTIPQPKQITDEEIKALVAECAPYIDSAKMQYAELVAEIAKSRKETAEFYSQELKNAYYEAKAFAMEQAELEALKSDLGVVEKAVVDGLTTVYTGLVETIEETRMTMLVNEDSPYQTALKSFREAKTEYLNYRNYIASLEESEVTTATSERLASYQTLVENTETALLNAGASANATLDQVKTQIKTAYEAVLAKLKEYSREASAYIDQISAKQTEAQTAFFAKFEADYAAVKTAAQNHWTAMQDALKAGYAEEDAQ